MAAVAMEEFQYSMLGQGYVVFPGVIDAPLVERLRAEVDAAIAADGARGHTLGSYAYLAQDKGPALLELFELSPLQSYMDALLGDSCIVSGYSVIALQPARANPIQNKVHRDAARFSRPYLLAAQMLYMVDDFTTENGATWILPGSHHVPDRPTDEYFRANAVQLTGKAGDAVLFDSLIWHAGGENRTDKVRRGITKAYCRHFCKQQIDLPRATSPEVIARLSERGRRLLGMNARVPANLDEFFVPLEERLYKPNQG